MTIGEKDKFYIRKSTNGKEWVIYLPKRFWRDIGNCKWMKSWKECIEWINSELWIESFLRESKGNTYSILQ
jgi:hypothetical protein